MLRAEIQNDIYDFQDFRRYYAELRGATLFLYTDDTHETVSKHPFNMTLWAIRNIRDIEM